MDKNDRDVIELKLDGEEVRLNAYVRSVIREVNLGILRSLDWPAESPRIFEMNLKFKLPKSA